MITAKILIDSVDKVKKFSAIISRLSAECEIVEGVHIIDAKSIMGIFSLDLSKPLKIEVDSDNADEFIKQIQQFQYQNVASKA